MPLQKAPSIRMHSLHHVFVPERSGQTDRDRQAGRQAERCNGRSSISFYEVLCANALLAMLLGARVVLL